MPNKNYRRGFIAEDRCLRELRAAGYWAERFHASKGTFDIIATDGSTILLIQVKRSKRPPKSLESIGIAYKKDIELMRKMPLTSELWLWTDAVIKDGTLMKPAGWRKFKVYSNYLTEMRQ